MGQKSELTLEHKTLVCFVSSTAPHAVCTRPHTRAHAKTHSHTRTYRVAFTVRRKKTNKHNHSHNIGSLLR